MSSTEPDLTLRSRSVRTDPSQRETPLNGNGHLSSTSTAVALPSPSLPWARRFTKVRSKFALLTVAALVGGALLYLGVSSFTAAGNGEAGTFILDTVRKGPFRVSVTERGTLDSLKNVTLSNTVEGQTTIIWIIPEGTQVKKGDLVCELDSSLLQEKEKQQQILVTQAKAGVIQASENVEIQKRQNESNEAAAKLKNKLAILDKDKYEQGEYNQLLNEQKGKVLLAKEDLALKTESYEFAKVVAKKGYKSQTELETSRIAVMQSTNTLAVEEEKLKVLEDFTYQRTIAELNENAEESVRELERVQRSGAATLAQLVAEHEARELTFEVEDTKLKRLQEQIAGCKLHAPQDGEVVYASQESRRSDPVVIEEGATVRERQTIIKLPDLSQMKVDAKIHESKIRQVKTGLPVVIRIDAFANQTFKGIVDFVSPVPASGSWPNFDLKQYDAIIRIDEPSEKTEKLKPGLTASIEIVVQQRNDVVQVPVQAVVEIGRKHFVYVAEGGSTVRREVVIGDTNDEVVEIKDGAQVGERVVMHPRTQFHEEIAELEELLEGESRAADAAQAEKDSAKRAADDAAKPAADGRQAPAAGGPVGEGEAGGRKRRNRDAGGDTPEKAGGADKPAEGSAPGGGDRLTMMFQQFDKNGDGKLAADEAPPQMQPFFSTVDANSDGSIDPAELKTAMAKMPGGGGGGRPPGAGE